MYVMKATKLGAINTKLTAEVTSGERGGMISNEGGVILIDGISVGEGELQFLSLLELFKFLPLECFQYCIVYIFQNK